MDNQDIEHLNLYSDEVHAICKTCEQHNMSLNTCYMIIRMMAPICDIKSPGGAIEWLERQIKEIESQT